MGQLCKIVLLLLAVCRQTHGLCDEDAETTVDHPFPNIFDLSVSHLGYHMSVEANIDDQQTTLYAEEKYDIFNSRGKTEILWKGKRNLIIYYKETDEYFSISENLCNVSSLSSIKNPFDDLWMDKEDDRVILGPSAMFRHAYLESKNGYVDYMGKVVFDDRNMVADQWRICPNSNTQVDFYFLDPNWNNHLNDKNLPIPLRVVLQTENGGKTSKKQFEFLKFIPFVENWDKTFLIPVGFGCQRLAKDLKQPVDFSTKDMWIEGELLYTMRESTANPYSYATTFFVAYDQKSKHLAHFYNKWEEGTSSKPVPVKSNFIDVYGFNDNVLYTINQDYGNCSMKRTNTYVPKVYMPRGKELILSSPDFLGSNEGFHYFGESEERNIPVSVFEKKVEGFLLGPGMKSAFAVITRYYTNDEVWYDSNTREQQVPIRITVRVYSKGNVAQLSEVLTFNVAYFSTELTSAEKLFDVSSCFLDKSMSRWFQINFPMEAYNIFVSMGYTGEIKDTFLKTVRTLTGISSLRIPKVLIDFDKDQMYVSALLLERPPYFYDFNVNENKRFKSPTSSLGLTTPQDCAKSCLESIEICWGFSYCGVICYLTSKTYSDNDLIEDKDCNVYKRVINPENTTPTSDMVISQLYNLVSTGNLFFSVKPSDNDMITYKALELFNDLASGINGLVYRPSDDLDSKFTVFKYTSKFDKSEEQNTKDVGRVFFDDCKRACVNLEMCESLSFCGLTGECLLSTKHGNEIPDDHIKKDSQCIILTRNYVVSYERLPGITSGSKPKKSLAIKDLNNCAKACSTEKDFDCKSFDHCPQSTESDLTCLLHETHFLDAKDTFVGDKASVCGHYTRDYIFDFKKTDGKKENGAKIVELQNVTAKACAKQCVDNADFNCQGFDFCQGTPLGQSSCFLIGKGNSNLKLIDAPVCAHYDYLGGNSVGTGDKKKRYSSGLAAGLSFFFIALGAVVGVVAFYMYSSRRVKN